MICTNRVMQMNENNTADNRFKNVGFYERGKVENPEQELSEKRARTNDQLNPAKASNYRYLSNKQLRRQF